MIRFELPTSSTVIKMIGALYHCAIQPSDKQSPHKHSSQTWKNIPSALNARYLRSEMKLQKQLMWTMLLLKFSKPEDHHDLQHIFQFRISKVFHTRYINFTMFT